MSQPVTCRIPDVEPFPLWVHPQGDQIISATLRETGAWEYYESLVLRRQLKPGDCFVDVGANIGYFTVMASKIVGPGGRVLAFEPEPRNAALLKRNVEFNECDNVQWQQAGLSDCDRTQMLYLSKDNWGDHRLYDAGGETAQEVTLLPGAEALAQLGVSHIDFIKIDTQGAEWHVLKGLEPLVRSQAINRLKMIVEFCPYGLRKNGASGTALLAWLEGLAHQYHLIDHHRDHLIPIRADQLQEWIDEVDAQAENQGFLNLLVTPKGYPVPIHSA